MPVHLGLPTMIIIGDKNCLRDDKGQLIDVHKKPLATLVLNNGHIHKVPPISIYPEVIGLDLLEVIPAERAGLRPFTPETITETLKKIFNASKNHI